MCVCVCVCVGVRARVRVCVCARATFVPHELCKWEKTRTPIEPACKATIGNPKQARYAKPGVTQVDHQLSRHWRNCLPPCGRSYAYSLWVVESRVNHNIAPHTAFSREKGLWREGSTCLTKAEQEQRLQCNRAVQNGYPHPQQIRG